MGHNDPALTDAFRVTARAVAAEQRRTEFLRDCEAGLARAIRHPLVPWIAPHWASGTDSVSVGRDFAAWLLERQDERELARVIFDAAERARLLDAYVQERAEADARVRERTTDWHAEAAEALAWERGGRP